MLACLGAAAILFGSVLALRQARLKLLIAYSTVAQIGYLFLIFPLRRRHGRRDRNGEVAGIAWTGGVLQLVSHAVAKAAMFMAAGLIAEALGHDRIAGLGRHRPRAADDRLRLRAGRDVADGPAAERRLRRESDAADGGGRRGPVVVGGRHPGWAGCSRPATCSCVLAPALAAAADALMLHAKCRTGRQVRGAGAGVCRAAARPRAARPSGCLRSQVGRVTSHERRPLAAMSGTLRQRLLAAALALPLAMLLACLWPARDAHAGAAGVRTGAGARSRALAPGRRRSYCRSALFGLRSCSIVPGALLLGAAALLWIAAGAYAAA